MKKYSLIAAVVAASVAGAAQAAAPSLTAAAAPDAYLNIAGSSAAQKSVFNYIGANLCDGGAANALTVQSSGNTNFFAISCVMSNAGLGASKLVTVYYRSEGGSVVGALPIVTGYTPYRLNLGSASCTQPGGAGTAVTCSVAGTSSAGTTTGINGPLDSWGGAVIQDTVHLGITDVEPSQLTNKDFPTNYNAGVWGITGTTQAGIAGLVGQPIIQQVFGVAVNIPAADLNAANHNSTTYPGSATVVPTVNLSKESVAAILSAKLTNWNKVPDALTGNPISTVSLPIVVINREPGSGTRTATNMYFLNYQCGSSSFITAGPASLNYSTGDELTAVVNASGGFGYASIDNLAPNGTKFTTLMMATLQGVAPSTLAAASGQYDFWYEATAIQNTSNSVPADSQTLSNTILAQIGSLTSAPVAADINVIPGSFGNIAGIPFTTAGASPNQVTSGGVSIYISPWTRNGQSCAVPKALF